MPTGSWYDYGVAKENKRRQASKAPHAYAVTQQPAKAKSGVGKSVSPGFTAGGGMQGGGRRRSGRKP